MAEPVSPSALRALEADLISRFADDVAHEIRNPLNALVINLEVLRTRLLAGDTESALSRVDVLVSEVRRTHDTLERLLMLLRPPRTAEARSELAAALNEILPLVQLRARVVRAGVDEPTGVAGSTSLPPDRLRFVLLDTGMAALDLVDSGGSLSVHADAAAGRSGIVWRTSSPVSLDAFEPAEPDLRLTRAILEPAGGTVIFEPGTGGRSEIRLELPALA